MNTFKNKLFHGVGSLGCVVAAAFMTAVSFTSCDEFFKQESDDVLYADQEHLNNAVDTIYSVTGILTKLQTLADRTILLGELRGDLVSLTSVANNDLREVANFNVSDDNQYNAPSDYYAVINNCNYFIAHADTALKSNRNEIIFMKEYAVVKAIRAWTYLQLVLNYGHVSFYTEPMLSKEEAENAEIGTKADLQAICDYFINDLSTLPDRYNTEYPDYRNIRGVASRLLFFPLSIVRGDLYLWRASVTGNKEDYKQAALNYYTYISERNGMNSAYSTGTDMDMWSPGTSTWQDYTGALFPVAESTNENAELITMIAGDSIRAEGHYSELRNLFTSREENDYKVSIVPSARMIEISEGQANCVLSNNGMTVTYAPPGLSEHRSGDLRLSDVWREDFMRDRVTGERIETQYIYKYSSSRNVHIYRRMMVYLRMAEALNLAGYPRMAYEILSQGLCNRVIQDEVIPYYMSPNGGLSDSTFLARFDFPDTRYGVVTAEHLIYGMPSTSTIRYQVGIHSRGSGWTPMNEYYRLPGDTIILVAGDSLYEEKRALDERLRSYQQTFVDSLILNEGALEFAFEGTRYYDIMRFAMRSSNPGEFMKKHIYARRGQKAVTEVQGEIKADLSNQQNWYLRWKGKIGY